MHLQPEYLRSMVVTLCPFCGESFFEISAGFATSNSRSVPFNCGRLLVWPPGLQSLYIDRCGYRSGFLIIITDSIRNPIGQKLALKPFKPADYSHDQNINVYDQKKIYSAAGVTHVELCEFQRLHKSASVYFKLVRLGSAYLTFSIDDFQSRAYLNYWTV